MILVKNKIMLGFNWDETIFDPPRSGFDRSEGYTAQGFAADTAKEQELQLAFSRITQWNGDIKAYTTGR